VIHTDVVEHMIRYEFTARGDTKRAGVVHQKSTADLATASEVARLTLNGDDALYPLVGVSPRVS